MAIDPTTNGPLTGDQRGPPFARISGAAVDMGAYESQTVSLVVNSSADTLDTVYNPAHVTLRDAVAFADGYSGASAITFSDALNGTAIDLTLGQLTISANVTITGNGAQNTIIDAQQNSRVFYVSAGSENVAFNGLTVTNGKTTAGTDHGAGIDFLSSGNLLIVNSTVSTNASTNASGGGIYLNSATATLTLLDSTVSGNSGVADHVKGAAIFAENGNVVVTNSTIYGNTTAGAYGTAGIYAVNGNVTVTNSTITKNSANGGNSEGAGIMTIRGSLTILNSIVSGNKIASSPNTAVDVEFVNYARSATFTAKNSLIGVNSGTPLNPAPVGSPDTHGNLVGTFASPLNAQLGPLAYNGGQTQTMALLAGSPAINTGNSSLALAPDSTPLTTDQRGSGFPRVNNGTVDMGAFEIRQILTDTTPIAALSAPAGLSTGNVVLATFEDEIPQAGLLSYISVPGASSTNVTGASGSSLVGNFTSPAGQGYLYNGTTFTTLDFPGAVATEVRGISGNNVVGFYLDTSNEYHGFLYNSLTFTYTTIDPSGSIHTGARAISGNIVAGDYYDASQVQRGFVYNILTSAYTTFAVPGATANSTSIVGISGGNVVGSYIDDVGGAIHGFLYNTLTSSCTTLDPSGTIATNATGISGSNVVGYYLDANWVYHGFLYNGLTSSYTTIDPPGSVYTGVRTISGNNVAGEYQDASQVRRGFVYNILTMTYTTFTVPVAATDTTSVASINGGNVVGFYNDASGYEQGFLYHMAPMQADFTPTVNWGGTLVGTPTVTVQLVSQSSTGSTWEVVGNATYANAGNFTPTVTVTDATGSSVQTANTQFNVQSSNSNLPAAISFAGEYAVATTGSNSLTLASIAQSGSQLSLNGSTTATAAVVNTPSQLLANGAVVATYQNNVITFSSGVFAGQTWTKLDLPANYTNQGGAAVEIMQSGAALTFVNKLGQTSAGHWISPTQFMATDWGNEIGTLGTGIISWSVGVVWSENLALTGTQNGTGTTSITATPSPIYVSDYINPSGLAVHLVQTGTNNVVIIDATGHMSQGTFINSTQFSTPYFPGQIATISGLGDTITWSGGIVWTQTARTSAVTLTNYTNQFGVPVHLIQNGTSQLAFVDALGRTALGTINGTTVQNPIFAAGVTGTLSGNTIVWSNQYVWTQTNVVPLLIALTDTNGSVSHAQLTSATTLVGLDGTIIGLTAIRLNGKLFWSNGQIWDNFDPDALNALFEMATGYP
jgi:hypothetical protein